MKTKDTNTFDTILWLIIMIPIALVILVVSAPFILYMIIKEGPIRSLRKKRFMERNSGKTILCISPGRKYQIWSATNNTEIRAIGIQEIVVFNPSKSNNSFDGFEWDQLISRNLGLPILLKVDTDMKVQLSLKHEFNSFFKKGIDWIELKETIKRKVDELN